MTPLMEEWSYRCQDVLLVKFMVSKEVFVFMKIGICAIQLQGHHKCFHRKCGNTDLFLEAASITNEAASSVSAFFSSSPSKSLYSARTLRRLVRPFPLQRVGPSQHPGWAQRGCHWSNLAIRPKRRRGGDRPWSIDPLEGDETTPARWTGGGFLPRPPICREHAHEQTDYYVNIILYIIKSKGPIQCLLLSLW